MEGTILYSDDLTTWTQADATLVEKLEWITWTGDSFLVAGKNATLLRSVDGTSWEAMTVDTDRHFAGIALGDGALAIVGTGVIVYGE